MVPRADLVMAGLEPSPDRPDQALAPRPSTAYSRADPGTEILKIRVQLAAAEARADALAEALRIVTAATSKATDDASQTITSAP